MAGRTTIGPTIKVDGEQEFKKKIEEVNTSLRVMGAEMKLVTAEYRNNDKSVQALTEKQDILQGIIFSQTDKVKLLGEALEAATIKYGEQDERVAKWRISLYEAQAELAKTNNSLEEATNHLKNTEKPLDEATKSTKGFGSTITEVFSGIGIKVPSNINKAIKSMNDFDKKTMLLVASTGALIGITTKLISNMLDSAKSTAVWANELNILSEQTGISVETLQELEYTSKFIGVSVDTINKSMSHMIKTMSNAAHGSKTAEESFKKLHVRFKDGNGQLKNSEQIFYEIVDALGKVRNETERDALAMEIFGNSTRELNPLILAGSDGLKGFTEEANKLGLVMTQEEIDRYNTLNNTLERLGAVGESVSRVLGLAVLPILERFSDWISKINPQMLATIIIIATVVATVVTVISTVATIVKSLSTLSMAFESVSVSGQKALLIILAISAALIVIGIAIAAIKGYSIAKELEGISTAFGGSQSPPPRYANGTLNHPGGRAWVGEEGPELVDLPAGTRVYPAQQSRVLALGQGGAGGDVFNISVNMDEVSEIEDFVRIAKNARRDRRSGKKGRD